MGNYIRVNTMQKITSKSNYNFVRIYILKILHLTFKVSNYNGIQSWYEGDKKRLYFIEINFKEGEPITLEYTNRKTWIHILKLIDDCI